MYYWAHIYCSAFEWFADDISLAASINCLGPETNICHLLRICSGFDIRHNVSCQMSTCIFQQYNTHSSLVLEGTCMESIATAWNRPDQDTRYKLPGAFCQEDKVMAYWPVNSVVTKFSYCDSCEIILI